MATSRLPFQISIVARLGIFRTAAAAAWSMPSNLTVSAVGTSSCEVSASHVKLGQVQDSLQALKKSAASTMKDTERFSSVRLALAIARASADDGILSASQPSLM